MRRYKMLIYCLLAPLVVFLSTDTIAETVDKLVHRSISFITVPKTNSPPKLDGNLNDACWQQSIEITNFVLTAGKPGKPATHQTHCYLLYDDTHLYIAFRCIEPNISAIKATSKIWDDLDILYDERVEIFLDVNHDHRNYYELAVNPDGVQFDQKGFNRLPGSKTCDMDPSWNCFWRAKTKIEKGQWIAEIAIDVTSFGVKRIDEGMTWGLNLCRVRQPDVNKGDEFFKRKPGGNAEYSAWALVRDMIRETISNFHSPIEFGDMVFGKPGFRVTEISFRSAKYAFGPVGYPSLFGRNPLNIQVQTDDEKTREIELKISVEPPSVKGWQNSKRFQIGSNSVLKTFYYIPEDRENKITIQFFEPEAKNQLYRTSYIELIPPFIEFNLEPLYTRHPKKIEPIRFRLLTDEETCSTSKLYLEFCDAGIDKVIAKETIGDLPAPKSFMPVFDITRLRALPGGNYYIDCRLVQKDDENILAHFRQNLTKFDLDLPTEFHAVEGNYSYGGITNHAIRIRYPFSAEFVFWRSASYIPWWDVEQAAMTNEFVECWGAGNQGSCEPMQDRECRYSRVELVENSPARAVVHWRYALSDSHYRIYRNEWVDEYYVLYPDGVGVRQVNLWPNSSTRHEMFEALLAKPPGVQTEQLFDDTFATLSNLEGEGYSNKYLYANKSFYKEFLKNSNDFIVEIHFKDRMHPFTVFSLRDDLMPGVTRDHITVCSRIIGTADRRGHWPASRYQIDGFNTVGLDVPHHGNIGNIQAEINPENQPTTWTFLTGVAEAGSNKPQLHARSWLYPAQLELQSKDFSYNGFDFSQRAYLLKANKSAKVCKIKMKTHEDGILNPIFLIQNPNKTIKQIKIDNKGVDDQLFQIGLSEDKELVIFLDTKIHDGQTITFEFK